MSWQPSRPMTAAERHVDFPRLNTHIDQRREVVERMALPAARRLASQVVFFHGLTPRTNVDALAAALERSLQATGRFGYAEARREIGSLRKSVNSRKPVKARVYMPDVGRYSRLARLGLAGVLELARQRARQHAQGVADDVANRVGRERDQSQRLALALAVARRSLHNRVLELVGETLNMGRTAGALSLARPPEFAMRSEQLDKSTCDPCGTEHGEIYQVDGSDYYAHLPPSYCLGGGRCRGVMVYADGVRDVRQPEREAA